MSNENGQAPVGDPTGKQMVLDIPLQISVEIGRAEMLVKDLVQLREGQVVELDKINSDPLDIYVNGKLVARGEALLIKDRFGIKLTEVVSPQERIQKLA